MAKKIVMIGGVAGGATTAARLRRRDEEMQIIVLERGEYISYANCGLPYYIGDTIKSRDALLLQTPEAMNKKFNIDVRVSNEVTKILPAEKKVVIHNTKTNEYYEESYDHLVIATGSSPIKPAIPGIDNEAIFPLWTIPDTDGIKSYIKEKQPKTAAVIGGGFIGLEMSENLHRAGLQVSLIEMQDQVMASIDGEMANLLHENMEANQVNLFLGDGVKAFHEENGTTKIELLSGNSVEADLVILSIGVKPNSELAAKAGIALNKRKGIVVNEYLQTSEADIYAVGDVIGVEHYVTGETTMIPLAGPANKQARILADNLSGDQKTYNGTMGTSIAKVFDLTVASVGVNEKQLRSMGKVKGEDYYTVLINQKSHAGYYPGATALTLKMIFTKDGKILGGQIVGQDGVDKRIDTLATTMRLKGTIYDLEELELAYAPPFSSAKDPVNMLGFVAENVIRGMLQFIEWNELDELLANEKKRDNFIILDVTEDIERMVYSIPTSYHIPLGQLHKRLAELDPSKQIITYCAIGVRAYNAARILLQHGFAHVSVLSGGITFYKSMHYYKRRSEPMNWSSMVQNPIEDNDKNIEEIIVEKAKAETKKRKELDGEAKNADLKIAETKSEEQIVDKEMKVLDCCGLQCPGPIMKVHETINEMKDSEILKVSATDLGFAADIDAWCRRTGNTLMKTERVKKENIVYIRKGTNKEQVQNESLVSPPQGKTLIVFSGDLDKVLASFIIANGAASMGRPVTMFFTFWGLNALRKAEGAKVKKPFMDKMFGFMMPKGSRKLKLSKMNMAGMGTAMMKKVMNDKNVDSLETLMKHALDSGIRLVACTMSMDIMGITKEELIEGVEYAGVASYLGDAEESNVNLFI
ncbi:DsrE/DsrF/DrsH-like family protein [Anaerosporobacter faecicola]|uniref:DsrE/DsrF/DrsH-like family protein n=1 Tax=Anaerosporobacter faecicola TaxID=2718714 RepID=UPI00143BD0EB|nr:DsrE/DsrF/DrsH-like family protein [Anaerosporobacter faecicola]